MDMTTPRRIVVKVGTSVLTDGTPRLSRARMLAIVEQIVALHRGGHQVILVSSGAMAAGREQLGFPDLARDLPLKQMLSAVGQGRLMGIYGDLFGIFEVVVAQVLLTRGDLGSRVRYLNARDTLGALIAHRIIPIINENDTTATEEIRVGDNDNLSALVATLIEADALILLTDQPGLFTADPRREPTAELIARVAQIDAETFARAGGTTTGLGTGGMTTKIQAAQLAGRGGVTTWIAAGREPNAIARILGGDDIGTRFDPSASHLESRKRWLLTDQPTGTVRIDAGAAAKIARGGISLLPIGVRACEGDFKRGATVRLIDPDGRTIAHGVSSYDSDAIARVIGHHSADIPTLLGYSYGDALVHCDNLVVLK